MFKSLRLFPTIAVALPLAVASTFVLSGCSSEATPSGPAQGTPVTVAAALQRDVTEWDEFTGRVEAVESVEIRPRVTGYIESVNFTEGSTVRQGDLLFVIDPRPYRAALDKAAAELTRAKARAELARNDIARSEKLLAIKAVSQEEYDQRVNGAREADATVAAAQAAVESARLDLEFTRVTAPISGRVSKAEVTAGNLVTAGAGTAPLLTTVVSIDPIYVSFEGDEQVYLKYTELARRGERASSRDAANPVQMGLANEDGYPHTGTMVFVDNRIDPRTGTIRARASFSNKDGYFTPGLFARVKLLGHNSYPAVLVDDRAVGTDQSQKFVYVVDADNKVTYRAVKIGRLNDGLRIVQQGLAPGENVVVNGLQRVHPGVVVKPELVAMDARQIATEAKYASNRGT
ncbi:RND family efflux transporter MFP subunit [Povalibacter uvarum]|uniref:RND family efflux transporter MFP subunit n=1 Tax=Povalibacter uvarum TaxID=732238 RepID=A0A841HKI6_9GAMM|nr:efflux RND transporter periplasmic adaptor subunit [Povalibacter uvarum]MBB6093243.1 RND family efflux transporter MFP subunit [Povalibacter uvarum]